jgi:hypothetical protein
LHWIFARCATGAGGFVEVFDKEAVKPPATIEWE